MKYLSVALVLSRLADFAVCRNANLSVLKNLPISFPGPFYELLGKRNFLEKMGNLGNELFQLLKVCGINLRFYRKQD